MQLKATTAPAMGAPCVSFVTREYGDRSDLINLVTRAHIECALCNVNVQIAHWGTIRA